MIRQISNLITKSYGVASKHSHLLKPIKRGNQNILYQSLYQHPSFSFSLMKQLTDISKDIYKRKQFEYEEVLNQYTKEELEKLEWDRIVESVIVISQYTKVVESLDLSHKSEIKVGLQVFLNILKAKNLRIQDYFELFASNYYLLSHKEFRKYIDPLWAEYESKIDSLDINEVIKIGYLYQVPFLTKENNQDGKDPHLDVNLQILSRNAPKFIKQLEILHPDLTAYLCVLLKFAVVHAKESNLEVSEELKQLITQLTEKITEDIHYYSPQKLYQIMDHVIFLSGSEYFEQVCIYFEKRLIEQDKQIQQEEQARAQTDKDVIDFSKEVENKQPLYINQWLDMCLDVYTQGRQNLELFEYVKQKLNDPTKYDISTLKRDYIPQVFFIFAKSDFLDPATVLFYKQFILDNLPKFNQEQIAKIYFSFSYTGTMDDLVFENLLYYLETNPLDQISLGILFFSLATTNGNFRFKYFKNFKKLGEYFQFTFQKLFNKDQYSERLVELIREDRVIYVLEAEDEYCDSQFLLSFLFFLVKKNQLSNEMYQGYIFEKFKEWNLGSPEETQSLLVNVLKVLNENVEETQTYLSQDFKNYLVEIYQLNKAEMFDDVQKLIENYLVAIGLNPN